VSRSDTQPVGLGLSRRVLPSLLCLLLTATGLALEWQQRGQLEGGNDRKRDGQRLRRAEGGESHGDGGHFRRGAHQPEPDQSRAVAQDEDCRKSQDQRQQRQLDRQRARQKECRERRDPAWASPKHRTMRRGSPHGSARSESAARTTSPTWAGANVLTSDPTP
jgi:hypothetical protein